MVNTIEDVDQCDDHTHFAWNKLEKTFKLSKLYAYADKCAETHGCDRTALKALLKEKLARKCLQRARDVNYDKASESIQSIPSLTFYGAQFVFKQTDNVSPLLSLAPKRNKKTVKHKPSA